MPAVEEPDSITEDKSELEMNNQEKLQETASYGSARKRGRRKLLIANKETGNDKIKQTSMTEGFTMMSLY